jgi:hypothetical protein
VTSAFDPAAVGRIKPLPLSALLYRGVRLSTLLSKDPPEPLFASGSQNRFNRTGVEALYFGENMLTAYAETVQENAGLLVDHPTRERKTAGAVQIADAAEEPIVIFACEASISRVLDLTDPGTLTKLDLTTRALLNPWRWDAYTLGKNPVSQDVGDAVFQGGNFEAIRYASEKADDPKRDQPAANWVIFKARLRGPSVLRVLDVTSRLQGQLP